MVSPHPRRLLAGRSMISTRLLSHRVIEKKAAAVCKLPTRFLVDTTYISFFGENFPCAPAIDVLFTNSNKKLDKKTLAV